MEGKHCYKASKCPMAGDTLPIAEYSHSGGNCSITGGYVYRGPTQAALVGQYVFADFCSGGSGRSRAAGTAKTLRADTSQQHHLVRRERGRRAVRGRRRPGTSTR